MMLNIKRTDLKHVAMLLLILDCLANALSCLLFFVANDVMVI